MIGGKVKDQLNKETILNRIDGYNIISHYLGEDIDFKKSYPSPFREKGSDNKPNLRFFPGDNNQILFKDFAGGEGGDCFKFIQRLFKIDYNAALQKIDEDFGLCIQSKVKEPRFKIQVSKKEIHKQAKLIQIIAKDFTEEDLAYWNDYHINIDELNRNKVFSVEKLYLNKQLVPNYDKRLRFAYLFDNYLKIYSPLSKDFKWISSCPNDIISGFDEIKHKIFTGTQDKKLIISKSVKDQIVLSKFFKDVCSTQNESHTSINEQDMQYILRGYDPEDVYFAYDNDKAGEVASLYYVHKYGFKRLITPDVFTREGIKDWSDLVKTKDLDTMKNFLKIKKLI